MGKFIKKVKDFAKERKDRAKTLAAGQTFMSIDRCYKIFFLGIDAFIKGSPSKKEELAFSTTWRFPGYGIDSKYNKEGRRRCKRISKMYSKNKFVWAEDASFLKRELRPYFESSYSKETGRVVDMLGSISEDEAKEGFDLYAKKERSLKRLKK